MANEEICIDPINAIRFVDYIRDITSKKRKTLDVSISNDENLKDEFKRTFSSLDDIDQFTIKIEQLVDDMENNKIPWQRICVILKPLE